MQLLRKSRKPAKRGTLWLHIGMDKTGTSAIQKFLQLNRRTLYDKSGVWYPRSGQWRDHSHHSFAFSILEMGGYTPTSLPDLMTAAIREQEEASDFLLSSECLFTAPSSENFEQFAALIESLFSDIRIIVYLRRQDKWVESKYKHLIISGKNISLEKLTKPAFCDYRPGIDLWADRFGASNIRVRAYEKQQQLLDQDLSRDFLHCMNIDLDDRFDRSSRLVNVSLGLDQCELRRLANIIGITGRLSDALNTLLIRHTELTGPPRANLLSPRQRIELLEQFEESNSAIARTYVNTSQDKLFLDDWPDASETWSAYGELDDAQAVSMLSFVKDQNRSLFNGLLSQRGSPPLPRILTSSMPGRS